MDYIPLVPVLLERSSLDQSWGFRLQGGTDFRLPLSIKKVVGGSPVHNKIFPGDGVAAINGKDTQTMSHDEAENLIRQSLQLNLVLRRGQLALIRPTKTSVKFGTPAAPPMVNPHANSALYNTTTPHNYRRF